MSIERIIKEAIDKNPLAMKAALEEELKNRIRLALEASDEEDDMDEEDEDMNESKKSVFVGKMEWNGSKWVNSNGRNVPDPLEDIFGKVYSSGKVQQIMLIRQTRSSPITGLVLQTGLTPKKVRDMINDYNPVVNDTDVFKLAPGKMWVYVNAPLKQIEKASDEDLQESHKEKLGGASYVASYEHNEKYRYFSQEAKKTKNPLYKKVADAHKKAIDAYDKVQDAANNEKTTNNQVERLYNKATDLGDVAEKITRGV